MTNSNTNNFKAIKAIVDNNKFDVSLRNAILATPESLCLLAFPDTVDLLRKYGRATINDAVKGLMYQADAYMAAEKPEDHIEYQSVVVTLHRNGPYTDLRDLLIDYLGISATMADTEEKRQELINVTKSLTYFVRRAVFA